MMCPCRKEDKLLCFWFNPKLTTDGREEGGLRCSFLITEIEGHCYISYIYTKLASRHHSSSCGWFCWKTNGVHTRYLVPGTDGTWWEYHWYLVVHEKYLQMIKLK